MKKKIVTLAMLGALSILTACGGKKDTEKNNETANNKNYVYQEEVLQWDLPAGEDIDKILLVGDTMYVGTYHYEYGGEAVPYAYDAKLASSAVALEEAAVEEVTAEEVPAEDIMEEGTSSYTQTIGGYQLDGKKLSEFSRTMDDSMNNYYWAADKEGTIYVVDVKYASYEGDDTQDSYILKAFSGSEEELWSVDLTKKTGPEDYFGVQGLDVLADDTILVRCYSSLEYYQKDGTFIRSVPLEGEYGDLLPMGGDSYAIQTYDENGMLLKQMNLATGQVGEKIPMPFSLYTYRFQRGTGYDFYLSDSYGVYGMNMGDSEVTQLMDFISSNVDTTNVNQLIATSTDTFFVTYYQETEEGTGTTAFSKMTKVAPEDVPDKQVLTLGCNYLPDTAIVKKAVNFNKTHPEYQIRIKDYSTYNTDEDYTIGATKFLTDISTGAVPDIMIVDVSVPMDSLSAKGVFADYYSLMDGDSEIHKEDYLENVFKTMELNGKLYQMPVSFYVSTVFGKAADVGTEPGWTMDDMKAVMAKKPEGTEVFQLTTKDSILYMGYYINSKQYIDWGNGTCHFNEKDFIDLLEFANTMPQEIDYESLDEAYWNNYDSAYREGRALLMMTSFSTYEDYNRTCKGYFGEPATPIGYPAEDGVGSAFSFEINFAISEKSSAKTAAWEFVKSFLTEEYQDKLYSFPIKLSSLDKKAKAAMEKPFYMDENGEKVEYDYTAYIANQEIVIPPMTAEEIAYVNDFFGKITQAPSSNEEVIKIIQEESAAYFSGQKSVNDVADIIQKRVQIYVSENR